MSDNGPKYDGVPLEIGGKTYVFPPLNFRRIKKLAPLIERLQRVDPKKIPTPEELNDFVELIHSALSRNYPDMTVEEVEEMVDLGNLPKVVLSVMGASGFVQGEKVAGESNGPTGTKSMPT